LLGRVDVAVLFIVTDRIERFCPKDTDEGAENVSLFVVELDQISQCLFDVVDRAADGPNVEARRKRNREIKVLFASHSRCLPWASG
jgi:hypothetical protein